MATNIETIRRITIEARTAGVEQANARLTDTTRAIGTMEGAVARVRRSFDPLFAPMERLTGVARTLQLAVASGNISQDEANRLYDLASAKITNLGRAMESASRAQQQWSALSQAGRQQLQQVQAASTLSAANRSAAERLGGLGYTGGSAFSDAQKRAQAAQVDPLAAAQQKRDEQLEKANAALKAGAISEEAHARSVAYTTATYNAQETAVRRFIANTDASGKAAKLSAYELQNLGYQANDVFSSLASGISVQQTLAQQGPQIFQILQGSNGGLKGGISAIGGVALSAGRALIGFGGALAGTTVALIAAAAAGNSYANSMMAVDRAVAGRGRASGSTAQQIIETAAANADAGKVSVRQAREMASEFASTGRIGSEMYGSLIRTAKDYAATTGQDLPTASKALAEAFADPAAGASALNKQLGFLNAASAESIERLARQGDRLGAQRALMDAYSTSLTKARDLTSGWGVVTEAVGSTVSDMWDKIGKAVANSFTGGETLEARLTEARRLLSEAQGAQGGVVDRLTGNATSEVQRLQGVIGGLQAQIAQRDAQNAAARRNQRDMEIKSLVDGYNQSGQALKRLEDDAKNVARALREGVLDPEGRSLRTMTSLQEAARQIKSDMAAGGAAYADAVRAAGFENRNVGTTGVALQRAQIEEQAQNKALAATRDTQDASELFAKLQSIEIERVTRLNTLLKETENQAANAGGALARVSGSLREQIIGAARGSVTPGIIAGIAGKESSNNPNVGFSKSLGEDGRPSSAYGLGQITKGTAEEAVRRGYLPQGFDRTDTSTMAQGIAGVLAMKIDQAGGDVTAGLMAYRGSKDPAINRAYAAEVMRKAGQFGDVSSTGLVKDQDALNRNQRDAAENLKNLTRNYGENGAALEMEAARRQKYNELLDRGVPAAEAASIAFSGMTDKIVQLGRSAKEIQFQRDLEFERAQLGRSSLDQSVYSQVRSRYGDTTSAEAQGAIGSLRELGMMKEARGAFQDTFGGVVSSLSRGSTAAQAFSQALSRLGDKLITMGTDALGGVLFGGGKSGGGGIFGGLLGGLLGGGGGSGGLDIGATSWMPKFADGGIMTSEGALPLHRYATGGIANTPQVALFGEGRGPEAFVPLPDGRRIPVSMTMSGAPANGNGPSTFTDARAYQIDARGAQAGVADQIVNAIKAYDQEKTRNQAADREAYRRMEG
ncbi:phage tail length tape measure family protein [Methylobacterium indicum]|uniref:Bacteriophage tail tape measure N-terminal domain-containing protein n=1 Tax=Methylobacterium indicum TaxID=1775910 RepID=A0ABR5GZ81_9HYPH|nr:phage tail length tape measure family protein [Methylobacterium indicum]KMO15770.1 hypothetical protein QR79_23830 [Methylobacterium indicum]KMO18046.1 hypothetical protein QR78_16175 [Methylobacterium indicum]